MQEENWVDKCLKCQHCYKRKDDDELLYCRKRNGKCEFKPVKKEENKLGPATDWNARRYNQQRNRRRKYK